MLLALLLACSTEPTLTIVAPVDQTSVCRDPLRVVVEVENFELVDFTSPPADGEGHVDLSLNGQPATMSVGTEFELFVIDPGTYRIEVQLVRSDHVAIDPAVSDSVEVELVGCEEEDP